MFVRMTKAALVIVLVLVLAPVPAPAIQGFCPCVPKTKKFRDMIFKYASVLERKPYSGSAGNNMTQAALELKSWVEENDTRVAPVNVSYVSLQQLAIPAPTVPVEVETAMALEVDPADVRVGPTPKKQWSIPHQRNSFTLWPEV